MLGIIVGHLIGDYVLQSDWMAMHKKKTDLTGLFACVIHCAIWTVCMAIGIKTTSLKTIVLLFLSHFVLDRTKVVEWLLNETKWMPNPAMWKVIVVDNSLHLLFVMLILIFAA